jgi:large subunit ribosomal protein L29
VTARAIALDNLRALSGEELAAHLREQRGQLFQVRLQQTIGQVENHRQIRAIRREIARTMTVQVEIRIAAERGEAPPAPSAAPSPPRRSRRAPDEPAKSPSRSRRSRAAAAPDRPTVTADAPVEEAISDVAVERVAAAGAVAHEAAEDHSATTDSAAEGGENDSSGARAGADEDTQ